MQNLQPISPYASYDTLDFNRNGDTLDFNRNDNTLDFNRNDDALDFNRKDDTLDFTCDDDTLDFIFDDDDPRTLLQPGDIPPNDLTSTLFPPGPSAVTFDDPGLLSPSHPEYFSSPSTLDVSPPTPTHTPGPECDIYHTDFSSTPVAPHSSPWHMPKTVRNLSFHSAFVSLNSFHH